MPSPGPTSFLVMLVSSTLVGCAGVSNPGTQVGVENGFACALVSSETLSDLDAAPTGFGVAPSSVLAGLVGSFSGEQLDEDEQPLGARASLGVIDDGAVVVLQRYEPVSEDETSGMASHCPPMMVTELAFSLSADGLPDYADSLPVQINADGEAWVDVLDPTGFSSSLAGPSSFDPAAFDESHSRIVLSGGWGTWAAYVSWEAHNTSDAAADGDHPVTRESLLFAVMDAD